MAVGSSFHQPGTVNENVLESDFVPLCVLFVKKVAKSSAVKEVVGVRRGGQRRELNVLKILRVSDALLILLWKYEALAVWTSAEKDQSKDW